MKHSILSTITVLTILFSSCGGMKNIQSEKNDISKLSDNKWQLIELAGKVVEGKVNNKVPYLNFLPSENRYSATGGCNIMSGTYSFTKKANGIHFVPGISTMMACEDMESDRALAAAFSKSNNYSIVEGVLSLNHGKKALAKFRAIETIDALAGTWELDYLNGGDKTFVELFPQSKPTLKFDALATSITGRGGCNNYNAKTEIKGRSIKVGSIMSTRMACPGNGESVYYDALGKVNKFDVSGETLTLIVGDIAVMRFKKVN